MSGFQIIDIAALYAEVGAACVRERPCELRCFRCNVRQPITASDAASCLRDGWPKHCGRLMDLVPFRDKPRNRKRRRAKGRR